jgi:hypothetical protein
MRSGEVLRPHDSLRVPDVHPLQSLGMPAQHTLPSAKYALGILEPYDDTQLSFRHDGWVQKS